MALAGVGQIELVRYFSKSASTFTKRFDFEDSMIEPLERFFRAFGAKQIPCFHITKTNSRLLRLRSCIKSLIV
jgi:hypothetical protein